MRILVRCIKKKIQSVLVDCQRGIVGTLRVKPLTWGHGSNFGSPRIWVVTNIVQLSLYKEVKEHQKSNKDVTENSNFYPPLFCSRENKRKTEPDKFSYS